MLEKENLQLQIDRSAKEQVIGVMVDERRGFIERLTNQGREIGRLEMQVQQLEAPKDDKARHDATEVIEEPMAFTEEGRGVSVVEQLTPVAVEPNKRKSWWR